MADKVCPLCKQKIIGPTYEIGSHPECCKKCYDQKRFDAFVKTSPEAQKYMRHNLILSFIGMLMTLAIIVGVVMIFDGNVQWGVGIIATGLTVIAITVRISFNVDKKLYAVINTQFPDIKNPYELPENITKWNC